MLECNFFFGCVPSLLWLLDEFEMVFCLMKHVLFTKLTPYEVCPFILNAKKCLKSSSYLIIFESCFLKSTFFCKVFIFLKGDVSIYVEYEVCWILNIFLCNDGIIIDNGYLFPTKLLQEVFEIIQVIQGLRFFRYSFFIACY